ncbi:MAG: glycosyltransferase [Clostridium sp.]|nr:glycosyltransferase [Clostridium sp.]
MLIVNTVYQYTSTGQITYWFAKELKKRGHECLIAAGSGENTEEGCTVIENKYESYAHYLFSLLTGYEGRFSPIATRKLLALIEEYQPDVIQLFNLHGYYLNIYKLFQYIKQKKIPTVYTMLDEYPYLGHCCYAYDCDEFRKECRHCKLDRKQYIRTLLFRRGHATYQLKKKAYEGFSDLCFTAPKWVCGRAKQSALLRDKKVYEVDEFVDVHSTYFIKEIGPLREKLQISQEKIIFLNVAVFSDPRKGGAYYLEAARRTEKTNKYVFIHVGYDGSEGNLPANFIPVAYVKNQNELADYFSLADKFICTSMADTMPNTCLESLACGTPVCGFDITGIPYVADQQCGSFVEAGNVNQLIEEIEKTEKKSDAVQRYCRGYALSRYSVEAFCDKMLKIYKGE